MLMTTGYQPILALIHKPSTLSASKFYVELLIFVPHQNKLTFTWQGHCSCFCRASFGVKIVLTAMLHLLATVLKDLIDCIAHYINDCLVFTCSASIDDHVEKLCLVLHTINNACLHLHIKKCYVLSHLYPPNFWEEDGLAPPVVPNKVKTLTSVKKQHNILRVPSLSVLDVSQYPSVALS
ncbi:hypothetical protein QOT17_020847 [Balamuthia mandrillaris]